MKNSATTWNDFFKDIQNNEYSISLHDFLDKEYANNVCYPPRNLLFNAFKLTALKDVKVVIIGQDPYHEPGQAMGLSFSVPNGIKVPPSLINIYKEISNEYGCDMDYFNGDLTYLSKQGVLMLNSILSVRAHLPMSHNIKEYKLFFQDVLDTLENQHHPIVYMLWGGPARSLKKYLHNPNHLILECNHPSPLSANRGGWFGNNHFKEANKYLKENGSSEINWCNKK